MPMFKGISVITCSLFSTSSGTTESANSYNLIFSPFSLQWKTLLAN